ncbi:flagellar filament capping protein FliD [Caminicella sporogenes]|uniref:flagellar filament capping protein FliD n=1 Tax=Caminicella sporogenes TaxID=166485 RepID=UPI0025412C0A|nr:flagellar filament capping protein FliD [Caminicella sporogenes]WIF93903.1 flagellar filament capping protein FliD [Caminicella sporogenes]
MAGMRVFGFGSGMDIDKMVSDLMKAERARTVDKLEKEKQITIWKQEMYQDINRDIAKFIIDSRDKFDLSGKLITGGTYVKSYENMDWVKQATSSNESVLTASATAKALDGSYKINITQLAKGVSKNSTVDISVDGMDEHDKLYDQFLDLSSNDILSFTITTTDENGNEKTQSFTFDLDKGTSDTSDDYTLDDIITEINNSDLDITVSYDSNFDRVFINSTSTGANVSLKIVDESSISSANADHFFSDILKINIDDASGTKVGGQDLKFTLGEGSDVTTLTYNSNTFSINGINITANGTGESTITVKTDVDGVYEKIKEFVESYNKLIDSIDAKLSEKVYRDYKPLTDEERKALTEDQIKKWEEMAKSGLLKNDSILEKVLYDARKALYEIVQNIGGTFKHLTDIGIDTGTYSEKGKLFIDEAKLKQAISNDANGVMELLFKESDSSDEETKYNESGLITRLFDSMTDNMKKIIEKAGPGNDSSLLKQVKSNILVDFTIGSSYRSGSISFLQEDILDITKEIYKEEDRLKDLEDMYYKKFTAMETALAQMNNQSNWLASQLGGM